MLELSVNLGTDIATKVTVSDVQLNMGFFSDQDVDEHHFIVGENNNWLYTTIVKADVLERLGNPAEVWIYVE